MRIKTRVFKATAIWWTGSNKAEMKRFCGEGKYICGRDGMRVKCENSFTYLVIGCWVVKKNGILMVYSRERFRELFELA